MTTGECLVLKRSPSLSLSSFVIYVSLDFSPKSKTFGMTEILVILSNPRGLALTYTFMLQNNV